MFDELVTQSVELPSGELRLMQPAYAAELPDDGAVEWAPLNIRVNCVAPGAIETEGWNVYSPQARAAYPRSNPMMRAGSPWDIAEACAYLAGPSGKFVTGETLTVDGGGQLWGETWTTGKPPYFSGGDV